MPEPGHFTPVTEEIYLVRLPVPSLPVDPDSEWEDVELYRVVGWLQRGEEFLPVAAEANWYCQDLRAVTLPAMRRDHASHGDVTHTAAVARVLDAAAASDYELIWASLEAAQICVENEREAGALVQRWFDGAP